MNESSYEVEFMGGPLDGYRKAAAMAPQMPATVALPISENLFRRLEGEPELDALAPTSLAIYRLQRTGLNCRYYFLGTTLAAQSPLAK